MTATKTRAFLVHAAWGDMIEAVLASNILACWGFLEHACRHICLYRLLSLRHPLSTQETIIFTRSSHQFKKRLSLVHPSHQFKKRLSLLHPLLNSRNDYLYCPLSSIQKTIIFTPFSHASVQKRIIFTASSHQFMPRIWWWCAAGVWSDLLRFLRVGTVRCRAS
jgi:UV DNA damage repair endonuclease